MAVEVMEASDYACLRVGDREYYYGYEYGRSSESGPLWGFVIWQWRRECAPPVRERVAQIPYDGGMEVEYACPDRYECAACLLFGLRLYLSGRGALVEVPA